MPNDTWRHCHADHGLCGIRTRGVLGAAVSFIGFGLPAFLIMMVSAAAYTYAHNLPVIISAFSGLQAIIVALIANACMGFAHPFEYLANGDAKSLKIGYHAGQS